MHAPPYTRSKALGFERVHLSEQKMETLPMAKFERSERQSRRMPHFVELEKFVRTGPRPIASR